VITLDFIVNALSLGSTYALLALGMVIVYGILNLVNFAFGELLMITGYSLFVLSLGPRLPWVVMAVLSVGVAVLISYLTERVAFRPVREHSPTAMLITSFAVSTLLQNAALLLISPRAKGVPLPKLFSMSARVLGQDLPIRNLLAIATSLVLLGLLILLLRRTVLGIALRAASDNFRMARLLGVPANLVISAAFAISGLLAGVVALFWVGRTASVTPTIGAAPLLVAFVATVIGGMRSLAGAVVGGYIYGIVFSMIGILLPPGMMEFREAFMFVVVILILLFRPEGLVRGAYSTKRVG
jgi:branched-chain amino acid transport system permease protein